MLSNLIKDMGEEGIFSFDRDDISTNFWYFLLNLFAMDTKELRGDLIMARIFKEWDNIVKTKEFRFIRYILEILQRKINEAKKEELRRFYLESRGKILLSLEEILISQINSLSEEDFLYFFNIINRSNLDVNFYIRKILENTDSREKLIKLFFKLFPHHTGLLFNTMRKHLSTLEVIGQAIDILKNIDTTESLELLKHVFSIANPFLKIEILKAMQNLSIADNNFLLKILHTDNVFLKKEALKILKRQAHDVKIKAAHNLLDVFNPFGIRKKLLLDNVRLIEEENFKEAKEPLHLLSNKYFFWWEKDLRNQITNVLNKL